MAGKMPADIDYRHTVLVFKDINPNAPFARVDYPKSIFRQWQKPAGDYTIIAHMLEVSKIVTKHRIPTRLQAGDQYRRPCRDSWSCTCICICWQDARYRASKINWN
jgi:hypothetical protein